MLVIRRPLWGHYDTPFRRPTPSRPIDHPGAGHPLGIFGIFSYYELEKLFLNMICLTVASGQSHPQDKPARRAARTEGGRHRGPVAQDAQEGGSGGQGRRRRDRHDHRHRRHRLPAAPHRHPRRLVQKEHHLQKGRGRDRADGERNEK
jgi:hypothetical protein